MVNISALGGPAERSFAGPDYGVLGTMLAFSLGIGVYQACSGGKQRTAEEFLMADRKMHPFPVAMSLTASFISAITFMGSPAEFYVHGILHVWQALGAVLAIGVATLLFMPMFFQRGLTSTNEYLELRFCKAARLLGTFTFAFYMCQYLGIVLYAPSLALNAVTGLSLWGAVFSIGIVCTLYTAIGGMKAVLWTDVFQMTLIVVGFVAVIIQGSIRVGGLDKAWHISAVNDRLHLWEWSTDVTKRHTIWGVVIGGIFNWTSLFGVNQALVQRYLTCGSIPKARIAVLISAFGMTVAMVTPHVAGVVMYTNYVRCDPKLHGVIEDYDQMMAYFIMDLFGSMPGLPGLLTSAVFSASLSTMSSGLNALAAIAGEDVVKAIWPNIEDHKYTWVTKGLAFAFGFIAMATAVIAANLGDIIQLSTSLLGIFGGPILGLYSSGMFFPWVNSKGAIIGVFLGLIYSFWLGIGAFLYPPPGEELPLTLDGCPWSNATDIYSTTGSMYNVTYSPLTTSANANSTGDVSSGSVLENFYKLSYTWYGVTSWIVTVVTANIISLLTGPQDPKKLDPRVICPIVDKMYCCLPERWKKPLRCGVGEEFEPDKERYEYIEVEVKEKENGKHDQQNGRTDYPLKERTDKSECA